MALMTTDASAERPEPKHSHYVSMSNGGIYRAQRAGSRGYEDEHPEDWRPATPAEVEMYHNGKRSVLEERPKVLNGEATRVSPRAITLAEEDDVPATALNTQPATETLPRIDNPIPAPPPATPIPLAPFSGIPGSDSGAIPPAPAFGEANKSE